MSELILEVQRKYDELNKLKSELESKHSELWTMVYKYKGEVTQELIDYLYWETDVPSETIGHMAGKQSMHRHVSQGYSVYVPCVSCKNDVEIIAKSRTELRNKNHLQCDECVNQKQQGVVRFEQQLMERNQRRREQTQALRNMSYKEYLQTDHWKSTRMGALKRARFKCQLCNSKDDLNVHHRTYDRLGGELASDLIVLCRSCHGKFHDKI